jgi:hypothetical protein
MNFRLQGVQALTPDARRTEPRKEGFEWGKRREVERIPALAAAHGVTHQARVAEHAKVATGRRPAHVECLCQRTGVPRALAQHDEDLAPDRIGKGLGNGVHGENV